MRQNATRQEAEEIQEEFVLLVNDQIEKGKITLSQLALVMGVDRSATHRALNGRRKLTFAEVIKISQRLGIKANTWNNIGKPKPERRFLPLYGNVAASHWRVKGGEMETITPIRPIDTGDGDTDEQFLYFVNEGLYAGQYAVCLPVGDEYELEDGDMLIVEETALIPSKGVEVVNTTLKVVRFSGDRKLLVSLDDDTAADEIALPCDSCELKGIVIGLYRKIGKKK